ncbi:MULTISPECIES: hypothetical protein [Pseudomonas]|uniref:hypothetical protein n=1 Tax=Pseudomonas TaxID=286 RepID=UPI001602C401|nr:MULTISPECIES: hypothetical protein [Pseudomonas]
MEALIQLGGTQADCEQRSPVDVACCWLPEVEGITVTLKEIAEQPQLVESIALGSWPT